MSTPWNSAFHTICKDLQLPTGDGYTQDWVYELSEDFRTVESLEQYVGALSTATYGIEGKRILMTLVLDVANDMVGANQLDDSLWDQIRAHLRDECYLDLVAYWSLAGEQLEDCFAITPMIRQLRSEQQRR